MGLVFDLIRESQLCHQDFSEPFHRRRQALLEFPRDRVVVL